MLAEYIKHFVSGEINYHKNSQREWIKDKGPVIETNIGFIENYVDPLNIRSEFEGFVSCVDKITSQKYTRLVSRAEEIVAKLPWGPAFEKDLFLKPDFTSLIVLTFAGPSIPIGINIPNYDDIRQHEGFKNVDLANAYPKVTAKSLQFLTSEDANLIEAVYHTSETLSTALHELLGHGSGKLLSRNTHGDFNFDVTTVNPAIGTLVDSWYEGDESWSSKFVELSGPYEECRAETVALYLACFPEPYEAFGIEDVERNRNAIWLYMIYSGIKGMRSYKPENNKWGQSHCWARYVILRVLLEVDNFINFEFLDNGLFELRVDYTKISSAGFQAISNFLTKLGCFKATGDVKRGRELFAKYSEYDDTMLRIRQIVIDNIRPRECDLQCHFVFNGREPILINFEETFDGVIQSFQQRYPRYDEEMLEQWEQEYEVNHN